MCVSEHYLICRHPENRNWNPGSGLLSVWELKGQSPYLVLVSEWAKSGRLGYF